MTQSTGQVTGHVTVYHEPGYYCGPGPAVVCDPHSGRLTVAFRRVPSWLNEGLSGHWHPATELCLTHSEDYGASWSTPQVFQAGGQCPNLRRLHDGTLIVHTHRFELVNTSIYDAIQARWPQGRAGLVENHWPGVQRGTGVWRSTDGGLTWGEPAWLTGAPGVDALHPQLAPALAVRGNMLQTSTGRLLVSAYSFGVDNTSHLFSSDDDGRSWDWCATIASDSNETCLHETDAGAISKWTCSTCAAAVMGEPAGVRWRRCATDTRLARQGCPPGVYC